MITKKEDLINTYVKTDSEELVHLYLKKCKEFGFTWFSGKDINSSKPNGSAVGLNEDVRLSVTNGSLDYFNDKNCRELSLLDLKPRTKTEFVKCEFTSDKERAEAFIEGGLRYFTHGPVTGDKEKDTIPVTRLDELLCGSGIYRKVETEIDERQEFVETYNNLASVSMPLSIDEWAGLMYDSGKFKLVDSND